MRHASILFLAACELAGQACVRPLPPAAGLALATTPIVTVTYSDGYQAFASMVEPSVPPPACGWPLVVFVHPLGSTRVDDLGLQLAIAGQGYAVWSYDVRGHGQSFAGNPTHPQNTSTLWGPIERCDLAEQILFVANHPGWAGIVDASRVAVVGTSQGGVHAWNAAAWSGKPLAVPGRAPLTFPTITCAVANDYVAEPIDDWLRDGTWWSSWFMEAIGGSYQGLPIDAALLQAAQNAFVAQDPGQLLSHFANEGRGIASELLTSTVPVMYSHAYHDRIDSPLPTLQLLQSMPAARRVILSTIGHNTPLNDAERQYRDGLILRWLHRHLWQEANEVDLEDNYVLSEIPLPRLEREDPAYAWSRHHGADPVQPPSATRFYLHADRQLLTTPPGAPQAAVSIVQDVVTPQTFTAHDYLHTPGARNLQTILQACPLQEVVYSTTLAQEMQLTDSAKLHLRVTPQSVDWMLAVLLTVEAPNSLGEEVMLSGQALGGTASTPGIAEEHDLVLPPVAVRLPAGSVVRVRVRNLWLREAPMARFLEVAPRFHPFQVDLQHDDGVGQSWLDLPIGPVRPKLVTATTWYPLATAPAVDLELRGGSERAGNLYFIATGISGHLPGTPFLNDEIPLEDDWLEGVVTGAIASSPQFSGFLGFLDGNGRGAARLDFSPFAPLPAELTGLRLTFAAFVFDQGFATGAASNPCDLFLR
jgi:pimeloyl-ACP methyl ester carboxylesterase